MCRRTSVFCFIKEAYELDDYAVILAAVSGGCRGYPADFLLRHSAGGDPGHGDQSDPVYIELSRNTPLLVQLFFIYFGLPKIGVVLSGEASAIAGVVFLGGSYFAENFRSGLEAVALSQKESAMSLGMSSAQTMRYVILPQALRVALPGFFANVIFLIKETSVVSAIAVPDLMYVAKDLMGNDYRTAEALGMLVIFYLIIILPVTILAYVLERRLRYGKVRH